MTRRRLTLVVGGGSARRDALAADLIAEGDAVVVCAGRPYCILDREDRCPMVAVADRTMFVGTVVDACAHASRRVEAPRAGSG